MGITVNQSLSIESKDATTNTAVVRYVVYLTTTGQTWWGYDVKCQYTIDGTSGENPTYTRLPQNSTTKVLDVQQTISNASGKTVNASFSYYTGTSAGTVTGSTSVYIDLPLEPSVFHEIQSTGVDFLRIGWASDSEISKVEYSLDNGITWNDEGNPGSAGGNYTITTDIIPNTSYSILTRLTRASNGLTKISDTPVIVTTLDIARFTSVPNTDIGSSQTLTWSNPSALAAYLDIKLYKTDETTLVEDFGRFTGESATITPTASNIYNLTPNNSSITLRYYIYTTSRTTGKTYSSYQECIFYVTNSNPIFSDFTYEDNNSSIIALTGDSSKFVKGYSTIKAIISTANKAIAQNGATMNRYTLGSNSSPYSSDSSVNVVSNTPITTNTIIVYAIDSRNNSTKVTKTIDSSNYLEYEKIAIVSANVERGTGGVGTETTLTYSGIIWNNNFGSISNSIKAISYSYKINGTQQWTTGTTTLSPTLSGNTFSQTIQINGDLAAQGFDTDNAYDIKIDISDELSNYTYQVILGPGKPLMAYGDKGIAIGNPYDETKGGALQVYGNADFDGVTTAPTPATGTNDKQVATTEFVQNTMTGIAPINSPDFTGTPTAPTTDTLVNNQQIATTEFVKNNIAKSIYVSNYAGVLVKFKDASLFRMITVRITGNSYGNNKPIDTIIQGYHFNSLGNFINCSQYNTGGNLPQCTFMIYDGVICLWIPTPGVYTSLIIEAWSTNIDNDIFYFNLEGMNSMPSGSNQTACIITSRIYGEYSNYNYKNSPIYFWKVGQVVFFTSWGDVINLPYGVTTWITNISAEFKPPVSSFFCAPANNHGYYMLEIRGTDLYLHNYVGAIGSGGINFNVQGSYISES